MLSKLAMHRGVTYDLKWREFAGRRPALTPITQRPLGRSTMILQGPYYVPVPEDRIHSVFRIKAAGWVVGYLDEDTLYLRADKGYYTNRLIKGLSFFYNIVKLGRTDMEL